MTRQSSLSNGLNLCCTPTWLVNHKIETGHQDFENSEAMLLNFQIAIARFLRNHFTMSSNICTLDAATLTHLQCWVGKTQTLGDSVTAAPVAALSATLDLNDADPQVGIALPE